MLKKRIIPCLDVKRGRVVKGINFIDLVDAGDPVEQAKFYSENRNLIERVSSKYGVDPFVIVTIAGVESNYGVHHSQYSVFNALYSQIHEIPRRSKWATRELAEFIKYCYNDKLDPQEIATALTVATGFSVPVFIVSDAMKDFDLNADGTLNYSELNQLWNKLGLADNEEQQFDDEEIDAVLEEIEETSEESLDESEQIAIEEQQQETVLEEVSETSIEEEIEEIPIEEEIIPIENHEPVLTDELTEGIDTEFERFVVEMEGARFSSERKTIMEKQTNEFLINMRIEKMERTLIGDPKYRGGQSVHGLLDGGPYVGLVKIPVELDEIILQHKEGDEIKVMARLVDFSPSLKRPVLEASEFV